MEGVVKMFISLSLVFFFSLFLRLYNILWLKPQRLRSKLRKQGINGPPPSFPYGNIPEIKKIVSTVTKARKNEEYSIINHGCASFLFPYLEQWIRQYGTTFTFSMGNIQVLCLTHPDVVKDMGLCTSLDLGKPSYQLRELGPLLGRGILTSSGPAWVHQRKVIAPELYMEKVKGMTNLMMEAAKMLTELWESKIESEGGHADIRVDDDLRRSSSFVISKFLFGRNYAQGTEIFLRFRQIQKTLSRPNLLSKIFGLRYFPTKNNREQWRLEKEIHSMILKIVEERADSTSDEDLLQVIVKNAKNDYIRGIEAEQFIVDNCKNIYLAGYETTATTASWVLMLLASNPNWQDRTRAEVVQICGGHVPNVDMLRKLKTMTMVIQEALRLYPAVPFISREALKDMELGDIHVPKGINLWLLVISLHHNPDIWGPDVHEFNPERFANGLNSACKFPHTYMPFGAGPRICAGQHLAMTELKIILSLILSKFSFSISPKYRHSPSFTMVIMPEFGVDLIVRKV